MTVRTVVLASVVSSIFSAAVTSIFVTLLLTGALRADTALAQGSGTPFAGASPTAEPASPLSTTPAVLPMVRAERFDLVDGSGQLQGALGTTNGAVGLSFGSTTDRRAVWIGEGFDGSTIVALLNSAGEMKATMAAA